MYEFPGLEGKYSRAGALAAAEALYCDSDEVSEEPMPQIRSIIAVPDAVHVFTHIEWHMTGYILEADAIPSCCLAVRQRELAERYALPSAFEGYRKLIIGES